MQRLEVSGVARPLYGSLGVNGLTFWRRNYFFNFSTPFIENVNNTGTKHARIMNTNCILKRKTWRVYTVFKIFSTYICRINIQNATFRG